MEESAIEKDQKERKELVDKRLWSIQEAFDQLKDRFPQTFKDCYLESELLRETVESYLDDRQAYMVRNRMARPKRIMYHKIAGLMAAAVLFAVVGLLPLFTPALIGAFFALLAATIGF